MARYQKIMEAFMGKPWAILPAKLAQISELLVYRANGGFLTADEVRAAMDLEPYHEKWLAEKEARQQRGREKSGGKVAVLPIYGVITPRADMFSQMSGGTGMDQFMEALTEVGNDPSVSHIVLDVDSPGGQVDMVPEAAALIRQVRANKPVTAVANTMAASAAYWLASQATNLVVSPSAEIGSIGVYAAHNDVSEAQAKLGIKTTLISAGKYKTELNPFEPLSEEAREYYQSQVDDYYAMFTKDVAAGRNISVQEVRGGFGQGRMVTADKAVSMGMADKVEAFDQHVNRAVASVAKGRPLAEVIEEAAVQEFGFEIANSSSNFPGGSIIFTNTVYPTVNTAIVSNDEDFDADEPQGDPAPQPSSSPEKLQELRASAREAAQTERQSYLALLRRINR